MAPKVVHISVALMTGQNFFFCSATPFGLGSGGRGRVGGGPGEGGIDWVVELVVLGMMPGKELVIHI